MPKDPVGDERLIQLLALIRDDTGAPLGGGFVNFAAEIGGLESQGASVVTNEVGRPCNLWGRVPPSWRWTFGLT